MPCKSRGNAIKDRWIVCNLEASVLIHSFKVEKDEMIPTRSIAKITVSRNTMKQHRAFVRSLPSLEKAFVTTIGDDFGKEGGRSEGNDEKGKNSRCTQRREVKS